MRKRTYNPYNRYLEKGRFIRKAVAESDDESSSEEESPDESSSSTRKIDFLWRIQAKIGNFFQY